MKSTRNRRRHHKAGKAAAAAAPPPASTIGGAITDAARRWEVPIWVLVAVKLLETGSGSGKGEVSSTGAEGPFQFEPGTAASLGIKDPNNFHEAANGAARYLAENHKKFGTWNAALEAYNGGPGAVGQGYAYNEADAKKTLRDNGLGRLAPSSAKNVGLLPDWAEELPLIESLDPFNWFKTDPGDTPLGKEAGRVKGGAEAVKAGGESLGDLVGILTDVQTWIRLAEVIAGAVLIYLGLKELTGTGVSDLPGAKVARAAARI